MAEAFLSAVSKSDYNCQLSVKILGICQLSVTFLAICQLSVNPIETLIIARPAVTQVSVLATTQHKTSWTFSVYYKCNYIRTIKLGSSPTLYQWYFVHLVKT